MKTVDYILAKFLECDADKCDLLNSITMDIDELFDATPVKNLEGFGKACYKAALQYLLDMYNFACDKINANPNLYDGSVLEWDAQLLKESLEFLTPKVDLSYGFDTNGFYLELDNWDLYASVVDTINDDYNSGYSIKELSEAFTSEFYGGDKTPEKFESLLL